MESKALSYELLPKLMEKVGPISKDRKNPVGFKYRGIEDALNSLQPAMIELGLSVEIECRDLKAEHMVEKGKEKDRFVFHTTLLMDVVFVASDGSKSKRTAAGEGLDTAGDKATNKAMAAAFKYAIFLGLCIPVEDGTLPDGDATNHKVESVAPPPQVIPGAPGPVATAPTLGGIDASTQVQITAILQLAEGLQMPQDVLVSAIAKRGGKKLSDLTKEAREDLITTLRRMDLEQQANQTFSKS